MFNKNVTIENLEKMGKGGLSDFLGVEILSIEEGKMTSRLSIKPHHIAPNGFLHAATIIALADTTCGYASFAHLPEGAESLCTIELKSNYLGTVREGGIFCVATAMHLGRNTQVWDAKVSDEKTGKVIALFRCTQMNLFSK
ncbi:PaaI family thioesterase [uncultured Fusobacterium sp.]|jgi:1,4-dihydroxy-2-naphthoyl-CoA hydrolase|uniref:PaaI family thioesterase n=1 Tax=uncultured Fusobacterium sp. TaxID=159267 RepID=UPI0025F8415F|nr:PaaI family thioesterase [uncultured Fusobacterium sp.]